MVHFGLWPTQNVYAMKLM